MKNKERIQEASGSPSRAITCSADAVQENAERLADKIIQALSEEFDAFSIGNYHDISEQSRPIIIKTIVDNS